MFSYRHAFHAGNHADVLKHLTLVAMLKYLTDKDSALTVIDTHAGAGLYRLDGDMARTSAEATQGVQKLFLGSDLEQKQPLAQINTAQAAIKSVASALQDYLDALASFNSNATGQRVYPGSPLIIHSLLRPEADKLKLFELHPTDYRSLSGHVKQLDAGRMVTVDCANGFEKLKTLLPPPNKRALVLIDPSYEMKSDYGQVSACIQDALLRFPTGCYAVWYPIIPRPEAHSLPKKLKTMAVQAKRTWLQATLNIGQEPPRHAPGEKPSKLVGLRASGMFIINPPHTLKAALQEALPQVVAQLGRGRGKGFTLMN
ncbi:23S rRNA (adenine(2030)-N(6))-methyltransferase RlmJ [Variovorax sp. PCZ-1]|uniref:23S rRNA (adenine(2030)-N(6))-methyltransferase RlmJ n=1 Tax=Variovorax sp. PCZ-1 TaxID=2835533 RepID=UPI001BCF31FD|nr:23S rRNA (adenine(2030)-N(6))-methyltransferase RlmJ [Variovorax sp. PCZ-1]MBS7808959.1 23S rRNA (adenine(2030)-N(6))-methyltransferase RlmJ [Variovorax sp. PCZ-1]